MLNQNKKVQFIGYVIAIFGFFASLFIEKFIISRPFSMDRLFLMILFFLFISLNVILDYRKLWNFIFCKRYIIGIVLFAFLVINGYHGSSVAEYNSIIQPNITVENGTPIIGNIRSIRSDEFLVVTPITMSQKLYGNPVENPAVTAKNTNMQLYPLYANTGSISLLASPQNFGLLVLPLEQGYSFMWFFPMFLLFFTSFEFFLIMTNQNRMYSLLGSVLITLSPSLLWWTYFTLPAYGFGAMIMLYKFLNTDNKKMKILYSCILGWFGACYIMCIYPAWMLPYGYFFLGITIWLILKYRDHVSWKDLGYLIFPIVVIIVLVVPAFIGGFEAYQLVSNTKYPSASNTIFGVDSQFYYNYLFSPFLAFNSTINQSEVAQFLSFYPLPIILGLWQSFKNWKEKKHDVLLTILLVVTIFLLSFNYVSIDFLTKITFMSMSKPSRIHPVASFVCVIILIKLLCDYSKSGIIKKGNIVVGALLALLISSLAYYMTKKYYGAFFISNELIIGAVFCFIMLWIICLNHKKINYIFIGMMIVISCFMVATISPLSKGLSVMTDKPVAKEIQSIVEQDKDARWLATDGFVWLQSYALANGAKVINTVNYYPNFDFWHALDPEEKYDEVYNRYAHVSINMSDQPTVMDTPQSDVVTISLNVDDLEKIDVDYIFSVSGELDKLSNEKVQLNKIYAEDNTMIYKVTYQDQE